MNLDRIISEEINRYINEDILPEKAKKKAKSEDKNHDIKKNAIKTVGGHRVNYNSAEYNRLNPTLGYGDTENIIDLLNNDVVNVAAFARKMYPKLTPQGAQSKLRKKIKHEKSDSGSVYKLRQKEVDKAKRILDAEF